MQQLDEAANGTLEGNVLHVFPKCNFKILKNIRSNSVLIFTDRDK